MDAVYYLTYYNQVFVAHPISGSAHTGFVNTDGAV